MCGEIVYECVGAQRPEVKTRCIPLSLPILFLETVKFTFHRARDVSTDTWDLMINPKNRFAVRIMRSEWPNRELEEVVRADPLGT